jgi:hypothetical protein
MNTAHDFCILFINKKFEPARLEGKGLLSVRTASNKHKNLKIKRDVFLFFCLDRKEPNRRFTRGCAAWWCV